LTFNKGGVFSLVYAPRKTREISSRIVQMIIILFSRALAMLDVAGLYVEQDYIDKPLFIQEWGSVYSALQEGLTQLIAERGVRDPAYHTWSWPHFQALANEVHGTVSPPVPPQLPPD
jgi:hypothetical protein